MTGGWPKGVNCGSGNMKSGISFDSEIGESWNEKSEGGEGEGE